MRGVSHIKDLVEVPPSLSNYTNRPFGSSFLPSPFSCNSQFNTQIFLVWMLNGLVVSAVARSSLILHSHHQLAYYSLYFTTISSTSTCMGKTFGLVDIQWMAMGSMVFAMNISLYLLTSFWHWTVHVSIWLMIVGWFVWYGVSQCLHCSTPFLFPHPSRGTIFNFYADAWQDSSYLFEFYHTVTSPSLIFNAVLVTAITVIPIYAVQRFPCLWIFDVSSIAG